jgi:uncharacterized protein (DUF302 family)
VKILSRGGPPQALNTDPDIGLLLPCTVGVRAAPEHARTHLVALETDRRTRTHGNHDLEPLVNDVRARLERAITRAAEDALALRQHGGEEAEEIC